MASLLVGATALFNSRGHSFRTAWLAEVELLRAVDFSASRDIFFAEAIAPFFLLQYGHATNGGIQHVRWETVLPTRALRTTEAVVFGNIDQKWVPKEHLVARDYLWKTYSWGNHRDAALLARLDLEKSFSDVIPQDPGPHYGFQRGERRPSEELLSMRVLADMEIFGGLQEDWFEESPSGVKREPDSRIYQGQRIVMKRGAQSGFGPVARLETEPFAFRHTFYCFPLSGVPKWQAKLMLGILLSRLGRYRLFLTSGSWGVWHDSFVPRDILALPIRMRGSNDKVTRRIIRAVDALPDSVSESTQFEPRFEDSDGLDVETVLQRLDAAVLDLFELSPAERDLVNDFHQYTLEYNQKKAKSEALAPAILPAVDSGTYETALRLGDSSLAAYLSSFLDVWNRELAPDGEFTWALVPGPQSGMLAVVFETQVRAATGRPVGGSKGAEWEDVIERLGDSLSSPLSTHIRRNGVLRAISDTSISIVKRNERRLWTASSARQDAEATMLGLMSGAGA